MPLRLWFEALWHVISQKSGASAGAATGAGAGELSDGVEGSPQGGVVSPCLSNIFLHHVLDEWFENEVKPRLLKRHPLPAARIVPRYADVSEALP